jgi:L-lysine 2,3-aminomutase
MLGAYVDELQEVVLAGCRPLMISKKKLCKGSQKTKAIP